MDSIIKSLFTGFLVGFIFAALRLPIPAPSAIEGIVGILGIFLGYLVWKQIF